MHRELEELVGAGLSPQAALRAATANAGRFAAEHFDGSERFGTVAPGARADLLLLDANPLDDIGALRKRVGVMTRGRWYPADELTRRAEAVAAEYPDKRKIVDRFDSLTASGQYEAAVESVREAQQRWGDDPLLHESVVLSRAAQALEEDPQASRSLLRLNADLYPDFHAVYNTLGQVHSAVGDTAAAAAAFERALELAPCDAVATAGLEALRP